MAEQGFDISKYITAADIAAAVTAGIVAYMSNNAQAQDEQQPQVKQPQGATDASAADPTIRIDHGRIDINDPKLWKDGGVVNMNGNEIHVFKAPDGSTIRVNPYQLQAAGGDPMKAAMSQFADKVQNGQVDMDKLFAAGQTVTTPSGMPVTVNAPNGVSAQDAMAQVRSGMTVDPLGAQSTIGLDDSSLKAIQAAVDNNQFGSLNAYGEAMKGIKDIAGATPSGSYFLHACGRAGVPLTDIMKYAKMVQSGQTDLNPNDLFGFALRTSGSDAGSEAFNASCRQALYSVLNQSTSYNGTLVNTLSDF